MVAGCSSSPRTPVVCARSLSSLVGFLSAGSVSSSLRSRASTILRVRDKSETDPSNGAETGVAVGLELRAVAGLQSVQAAGTSERLPSGSTRVRCRIPWRWVEPSNSRACPCNGWRSRKIVALDGKESRWVVCRVFF